MTDKQIDARHFELLAVAKQRAQENGGAHYVEYTDNELKEEDELSCRRMMSSIFCYDGISALTDESSFPFLRYLAKYVEKFGRERFNVIRNEQIEDYKKCKVLRNIHTDSDGCTYNSIVWND